VDGVWKISQFQVTPLPRDWRQLQTRRASALDMDNDANSLSSTSSVYDPRNEPTTSSPTKSQRQVTQPPSVTEAEVRSWFDEWNAAMATGEAEIVANRYSGEAVMMSPLSETPRTTPLEILEFYKLFLWNRPQARALQSFVTISKHWCKDVGVLQYTLKDSEGKVRQRIKERYSFLYVFDEAAGWKIAHHHSAVIPEGLQDTAEQIINDDDKGFFQ